MNNVYSCAVIRVFEGRCLSKHEKVMGVATGCRDGKATPKLIEVKCSQCGELPELFVKEGFVSADEKCEKCGNVVETGTPVEKLK